MSKNTQTIQQENKLLKEIIQDLINQLFESEQQKIKLEEFIKYGFPLK